MELSTKTKIIAGIALLIAAFGLGYYVTPTKTVTKTEIKEVIKEVEKTRTDQQNNTETVEIEIRYPDGTVRIERHTIDKGHVVVSGEKKTETVTETKTEKSVERTRADWNVAATAGVNLGNLGLNQTYGLHVQRRIIGPVYLGAFAQTDKSGGISLGISF